MDWHMMAWIFLAITWGYCNGYSHGKRAEQEKRWKEKKDEITF